VTEQVGRAAADLLEEGDRVPRHEPVGDRAVDIGRAPVPAPVRPEDAEVLGELGHARLEGPRVREPRMQEHERVALAILLVVGAHLAELYVIRSGSA
jgi:hypothetical protein